MKNRVWIILIVVAIAVNIIGCGNQDDEMWKTDEEISLNVETDTLLVTTDNNKQITVHVCGEVKNPGVYTFDEGSRVFDAINSAGGFTDLADANSINQARLLEDSEQIRIYSINNCDSEEALNTADIRVNINTASVATLITVRGIGQSRAEAIVAYRNEHGQFKKIEDIMQVTGIKEGLYNKIKDQIKVN